MYRNDVTEISELIKDLVNKDKANEISSLIVEMLTESELETLSKRWQILKLLSFGCTQREIARNLGVSLCKVTRGSQILKNKKSVIYKYFEKEINHE